MATYTYVPFEPESYDGKAFLITPETGEPFIVSTATGEDQIPELVEFHLNPPPPEPYPEPGPPEPTMEDQILYDHENRLRTIEGQPLLEFEQFMAYKTKGTPHAEQRIKPTSVRTKRHPKGS
jgi:hypothetical protein